jgi:hypothetical protein
MSKSFRPLLLIGAVLALATPGCSRDPAPGTPAAAAEGERVMRQMSDVLAGAKAFRFSTNESLDPIGPNPERRVLRFSRTVTVRRPDAMYFELRGRDAATPISVTAHYDGRTLALRNDVERTWARVSVPATLDEMLDLVARQYSLPVPIADVVYSVPYEAFVGPETRGGFAGRENLDGVPCVRLAYTDAAVDVQLWVPASGQPLPRRVELTYKRAPGAPKAHIDFTSWDLAPAVADGTFAFSQGPATTEMAFQDLATGLLSGGRLARAAAPGPAGTEATTR